MKQDKIRGMAVEHAESVAALVFGEGLEYESVIDWLNGGVLDVKRTYNSAGELDSVELLVGFGGPNVWLTFDGQGVEARVAWHSEPETSYRACLDLSSEVLELFDDWSIRK